MRKIIPLFFIAFSLKAILLQAQPITNNGFEQLNSDGTIRYWGNIYISSVWIDSLGVSHSDSIVHDGSYYAPTNDAYSGSHALELRNAWNFSSQTGIAGAVGLDDDSIFSAWSAFNMIPTNATPFNPFEPFSFGFYYKFFPVNGDSAYAEISLWDSIGNQLAEGILLITDPTPVYTLKYINLIYYNPGSADFYSIVIRNFYTENLGYRQPSLGTRLIVDDLGFNFASVGTNNINFKKQLSVFPNPANDRISIQVKSGKIISYKIFNVIGDVLLQSKLNESNAIISLADFDEGVYFIEINNGFDNTIEKFFVNR